MRKIVLSVVIVSYNSVSDIIRCLDSIRKYNDIGENLEIIIVDNSTKPDVFDCIEEHYNEVVLIKSENKGFGTGNNIGARVAKGHYILFLNPDTELIEPIFDFSVKKFEENKDLALFGLKLLNVEKKWTFSFFFLDKSSFIANQTIKVYNKLDIFKQSKMFINGANIFIRRTCFFMAGMFDENIFMYNEESDLLRRIRENCEVRGISYFKEKSIIHREGKYNKTWEQFHNLLVIGSESEKYYCQKYGLDYKERVKTRLRCERIKLFMSRFKRGGNNGYQREICEYFQKILLSL